MIYKICHAYADIAARRMPRRTRHPWCPLLGPRHRSSDRRPLGRRNPPRIRCPRRGSIAHQSGRRPARELRSDDERKRFLVTAPREVRGRQRTRAFGGAEGPSTRRVTVRVIRSPRDARACGEDSRALHRSDRLSGRQESPRRGLAVVRPGDPLTTQEDWVTVAEPAAQIARDAVESGRSGAQICALPMCHVNHRHDE
jgi:hypothetical protein